MPFEKENTVKITENDVERKLKSMPDQKGAAAHKVLATVLNEFIEVGDVPGWLVEGRIILVMKDSKKGTEVGRWGTTD